MMNNNKFGRLTIIKEVEPIVSPCGTKRRKFLCQCECGNQKLVQLGHLKTGHTVSCGCFHKETFNNYKHGLRSHRINVIWRGIRQRCLNTNNSRYKDYGGRGISMCNEWLEDFMSFYNWAISNGYSDQLSIDRIDVNGNYEPSNCRWATASEQNKNQRRWKVA